MYTQCPDCQTAFRVTAEVLQKAAGRVRCGGCGNAFSAIDYLSEDLPGSKKDAVESGSSDTAENYDEKSKALLQTLEQLAGDENVRIEDTGIEWRVLDDDENAEAEEVVLYQDSGIVEQLEPGAAGEQADDGDPLADSGAQTSLDLQQLSDDDSPTGERRYDDNTPLPDDFDDEEDIPYAPPADAASPAPQRRADDDLQDVTDFDTHQIDLAIGSDDDWAELLDDDSEVAASAEDDASGETSIEAELAAAEARQLADDSALLPELAEELSGDPVEDAADEAAEEQDAAEAVTELDDTGIRSGSYSAATEIPMEVEEELAAIHSELASSAAMLSRPDTSQESLDAQFETHAEALGLEISRNEEIDAADDGDADDDQGLADEDDTAISGIHVEEDLEDDDVDDDFEDELTPDEEADIVEKLRESTGSFQKQIDEARQALERGDQDDEPEDEDEDEEERVEALVLDDSDEADADEELLDESDDEDSAQLELVDDEDAGDEADEPEQNEPDEPYIDEPDEPEEADEPEEEDAYDHDDELSQTMIRAGIDPSQLDAENIETIVMEGEFVRGSLDKLREAEDQEALEKLSEPDSLIDTYMLNKGKVRGGRRKTDPAGFGVIAGIVVLLLVLAAQYVHVSRSDLATYGMFNQTVGPIYRALGKPVTPQWNVRGWRFETTSGSTDENEQVLTISSRISNASEQALPYPLVHVSLTDRWEEIIGSKVLEPNEYLAGDLDPSKPVAPGDRFTAVIAIKSPSADATGFKLNVCYRVTVERVRCATEDFKN